MERSVKYHYDPKWKRTHRCGELGGADTGRNVTIAGWVKKVREFGDLTFLDLWDRTGLIQLVVEASQPSLHRLFVSLRAEDVIACRGTVKKRPPEMVNLKMATGEVEIVVEEIEIFNRSEVPPFNVSDQIKASDDLRLRYRYLDLRRDKMQRNLELRHRLALETRNFLSRQGFLEIETPMLVKRTPEGARDYLVPSRLQPGKFYALPQSPQLYKQILMVAGFDRYFQLARCLRDEDLRADRQPEHTQIDIEMSFVTEEEVFAVTESLIKELFYGEADKGRRDPFPRIDYEQAMSRYGSDKPDLRFELEISDCSKLFAESGFEAFASAVRQGGVVRGISFPPGTAFSNNQIKKLEKQVKSAGAKGLATVKVDETGLSSPLDKFLGGDEMDRILSFFEAGTGNPSLLLLVAGSRESVEKSLGDLRLYLGRTYLLKGRNDEFKFLWVNRFPLFLPVEGGGWEPAHHIFSMPLEEDIPFLDQDPGRVRGHLYDLVCNGTELGSGSIRIHRRELQEKLFKIIGMDQAAAERKFGFLLRAFEFGGPPHGGIALGLDRLAMIIGGESSIRDYIAFPKTQSAASLMEEAPSEVEEEILRELHIRIEKEEG
ncbi:MAG: aspartate--tRNA ligase [Candidatus Krumholzibacteriota bacterium]|nr:aspartate--tRNA ligase [Candidatus Krumholzibacteriota bacterium]